MPYSSKRTKNVRFNFFWKSFPTLQPVLEFYYGLVAVPPDPAAPAALSRPTPCQLHRQVLIVIPDTGALNDLWTGLLEHLSDILRA